jgi:hypothetical protein
VTDVAGAVFFHAELRVGPAAMRDRDGSSTTQMITSKGAERDQKGVN